MSKKLKQKNNASSEIELLQNNSYKIDITGFLDNSVTDFNIYIKQENNFVLYASSPYKWLKKELESLLAAKISLYIRSCERKLYEDYIELSTIRQVNTQATTKEKIVQIQDIGSELNKFLFKNQLTEAVLFRVTDLAGTIIETIADDSKSILAIEDLINHDSYTFYHSVRVATYACALALKLEFEKDSKNLQDLVIGCILHDIGKSKIPMSLLNKSGVFTPEDWKIMKLHPEYGIELISESSLSYISRAVILHHHERHDGSGYPDGLQRNELMKEVKIATFADVFDALTTTRSYQISRSRYEAMDFIKHNLLDNLDVNSFNVMVELLNDTK